MNRSEFKLGESAPGLGPLPEGWTEEKIPGEWLAASGYEASPELRLAVELAVRLQRPLLLTGRPGTGKTTAAYWAALHMGRRPWDDDRGIEHVQVKSTTKASDLLYEFDAVAYLRDEQAYAFGLLASRDAGQTHGDARLDPDRLRAGSEPSLARTRERRRRHVHPGPLWRVFESARPVVLLLDEMDKAPRDVPNDLLRELDRYRFDVPESMQQVARGNEKIAFLCVITSNEERQFPDAFLRRCLHHRIELDSETMERIAEAHLTKLYPGAAAKLPADFIKNAVSYVAEELKPRKLEAPPGLADLLVWLRAAGDLAAHTAENDLENGKIPERRLREIARLALFKTSADTPRSLDEIPISATDPRK